MMTAAFVYGRHEQGQGLVVHGTVVSAGYVSGSEKVECGCVPLVCSGEDRKEQLGHG